MNETRRGGSDRGFLLHAEPWRETSLLVDAWTRAHGRLWLVAKGAKRPHSALRSVLLPFQPLHLRWSGKGERLTLTGAEWLGGMPLLSGEALWCGYYLNELILRLAPREVPHPEWFDAYETAVRALAAGEPVAPVLRAFEWASLQATGHAPQWPETGPVAVPLSAEAYQAVAQGAWSAPIVAREVKPWLRALIDHCLEGRPLRTRAFMKEWVTNGKG
ncbi:DNA repair protein RecO [Hydrogenophilus thiooxidans]|jgi:DNA repair protein RecO (recombination protein O)|uniref:DNA repair protein RecO n=1 Tax=Hydrogenophilus thiooxidans TaxID=2820326 RepID=UPI001C238EE1|nr:DNA repair protein RecO [Hydrogenophilus thiooxidans]